MKNILTKEQLRTLMETSAEPCVSIYMPTHVRGAEIQQDPIRLKNMLRQAVERLKSNWDMAEEDAEAMLQSGSVLLENEEFWRNQGHALALFFTPDTMYMHQLPMRIDEKLIVSNRFHLKPLLPLLSGDGTFYVLALSQNAVRLLQATRYSVREVELPEEVPTSLDEAMRFDDFEREGQMRTRSGQAAPTSPKSGVGYGTGAAADDDKVLILRFFQQLSKGVTDILNEGNAPLILAGVTYLRPIYEEANDYTHLIEDKGVDGNPENVSNEDLREQAWAIIEPIFAQEQQDVRDEYMKAQDMEQAGNTIESVVPAAHYGRVSALFVALGQRQWGSFDADSNEVIQHDEKEPDDTDLVDLAAVQSYLNGGRVYAVEPAQMPGGAQKVAAVYRY